MTGSMMNPAPAQRPWSGGSNLALKLVNSLSRLLVPLKLDSRAAGLVAPAAADAVGADAVVDAAAIRRTPCERAEGVAGPDVLAAVRPGEMPVATRVASAGCPVWLVTALAAPTGLLGAASAGAPPTVVTAVATASAATGMRADRGKRERNI